MRERESEHFLRVHRRAASHPLVGSSEAAVDAKAVSSHPLDGDEVERWMVGVEVPVDNGRRFLIGVHSEPPRNGIDYLAEQHGRPCVVEP